MTFLTQFLKYLRQFWHNVKNISDYAVIAIIENRRIRIRVNGDNNSFMSDLYKITYFLTRSLLGSCKGLASTIPLTCRPKDSILSAVSAFASSSGR